MKAFFQRLQAGDAAYSEIIQYAFAVFGFTKVGKTTFCHYLCNNNLIGIDQNGEARYELRNQQNNKYGIIGKTIKSQTEIPNRFITKNVLHDQQNSYALLDCPGYMDTFGCQKMLANAYFHYRIMSKVKNIKFIIAIDGKFSTNMDSCINCLLSFYHMFKQYKSIETKILKATCLVVSKANNKEGFLQGVIQNLKKISKLQKDHSQEQIQMIKNLIDHMIDNQKIFLFFQSKKGVITNDVNMLQQIHNKTQFWKRQQIKNQFQINMDNIQFSPVEKTKLIQPKFKQQYNKLFDYQSLRHKKYLSNILNVIQQFTKDALISIDSKNYIKLMNEFILDRQNLNQNQRYQTYFQRRNIIIPKNTIALNQYWLYKIKTFQKIYKFIKQCQELYNLIDTFQFQIQCVKQYSRGLNNILSSMYTINQEDARIVAQYSYMVRRFLEETKVWILIIGKPDINNNKNIPTVDLYKDLKQLVTNQIVSVSTISKNARIIPINQIFQKYCLNVLLRMPEQNITFKMIDFMQSCQSSSLELHFFIVKGILTLLKRLKTQNIQQLNEKVIITKLIEEIISIQNIKNDLKNEQKIQILIQSVNILTNYLYNIKKYYQAIKCCNNTLNIYLGLKIFKIWKNQTIDNIKLQEILIQMGNFCKNTGNYQLALSTYQELYSLIDQENYQKRKNISSLICNLLTRNQIFITNYYSKIVNEEFYQSLQKQFLSTLIEQLE